MSVLGGLTILAYFTVDQMKSLERADSSHVLHTAKRQSSPIIAVSDIEIKNQVEDDQERLRAADSDGKGIVM